MMEVGLLKTSTFIVLNKCSHTNLDLLKGEKLSFLEKGGGYSQMKVIKGKVWDHYKMTKLINKQYLVLCMLR